MYNKSIDKSEILKQLDIPRFYKERIPSLQINDKPETLGLCPFHNDTNPSLSVNIKTGFYRCFACGAKGDIFTFQQETNGVDFPTALKELAIACGIANTDKPQTVAIYRYTDTDGNLLYTKERVEPGRSGKPKEFFFKHKKDGKLVLGRGCYPVLYRLSETIPATEIYITEGEAKVDLLHEWGLTATCLDSGSNSPWRAEYLKALDGKESVTILPDNDKPGNGYALKIASALYRKVGSLKVVGLPGLAEKGDIIDWSAIPGNDKGKLLTIIEGTLEWTPASLPHNVSTAVVVHVEEKRNFPNTDLGNGERLVTKYGKQIRFCHVWKKWLIYDGKRWKSDDSGKILEYAKATAKAILEEAIKIDDTDVQKAIVKFAFKSQSKERLFAMVKLAESEDGIPVSPCDLDTNLYLLNCLNGTLNLKTGMLQPHNPADYITKIIPITYDPKATSPAWIDFLETFFNWNYDLINFVQRAVGYSLTGDTSEQCLFIPHGEGENGKSTFIDTISILLGEFAQSSNLDTFMVKKNDGSILNDIARMKGARLIAAVESEEGKRLSEILVKQLTGGDTISARFLYSEFFDFRPEAKIWLACNHKPAIRGTDHAIWRRIKLIPFSVKISPEKKLPKEKVMATFRKELPGILAWAVQGCTEWQKDGLQTPEAVCTATQEYRVEMDTVQAFLDDECYINLDPMCNVKTLTGTLFNTYHTYCIGRGYAKHDIKGNISFALTLKSKGYTGKKSDGKRWTVGVGLNANEVSNRVGLD